MGPGFGEVDRAWTGDSRRTSTAKSCHRRNRIWTRVLIGLIHGFLEQNKVKTTKSALINNLVTCSYDVAFYEFLMLFNTNLFLQTNSCHNGQSRI